MKQSINAALIALLTLSFAETASAENLIQKALPHANREQLTILFSMQKVANRVVKDSDGENRNVCDLYPSNDSAAASTLYQGQSCWLVDQKSIYAVWWLNNAKTELQTCINELLADDPEPKTADYLCTQLTITNPYFLPKY